jgi:O-methyltransferase involved in polyketide biosynthesis
MQTGMPSRTALSAAAHRAAHQVLEGGRIFTDPLALRILGDEAETAVREAREDPVRGAVAMRVDGRASLAASSCTRPC